MYQDALGRKAVNSQWNEPELNHSCFQSHKINKTKDSSVRYLAAELEVGSSILHSASQKSQPMALGKLPSLWMPPEEGNGKPLLSTLYPENSKEGHCKSKLIWQHNYSIIIFQPHEINKT